MKTIGSRTSYGLFVAVIMLAGCGGAQSGSRLAEGIMPVGSGNLAPSSVSGQRKIIAACPDRRPDRAQCAALILDGTPERDGGSGPKGGFTPAQLQAAYNLPSASRGSGQIVAIVVAYDSPNTASDLATYRSYFGLAAANFYKFNQYGQQYNYPESCKDSPDNWCGEFALDPQMVSASCPNCTIYLIEANSDSTTDLEAAEAEAVTLGAHIVTNSWYFACSSSCDFQESYFDRPGVVYLAAAGDAGYLAAQPMEFGSIVSVGGTHLVQGGGKRGWSETVCGGGWYGGTYYATGAACSTEPKPSWQHDPGCKGRTANDVSAVADPVTGVSAYDTYDRSGWFIGGGTSVASPLIAGVFALAGNATSQDAGRTFWEKRHQNPNDLNPVLHGSDGHCSPTYLCSDGTHEYKDYGGPTGWGTPNGIGAF
jgi:subtilase family serine protease